ncbi:MAG: hypothetical protein WC966_03610 [Bradymonadales bacterium]
MGEQDKLWLNDNILNEREASIKANRDLREKIIDEIETLEVKIDDRTQQEFINGYDSLIVNVNKSEIDKLSEHSKLIGIELFHPSEPESIASAMNATYVTQSAGYVYNRNGQGVGVYIGDEGCPASSYLNNYQRLVPSDSDSNHERVANYDQSATLNMAVSVFK